MSQGFAVVEVGRVARYPFDHLCALYHRWRDLDGLLKLSHILEELCSLGKLFLFANHGNILEPYPPALVFVPAYTSHTLERLNFARKGLPDGQCHHNLGHL